MELLEIQNVDEIRQIIERIPVIYKKAPSFILMIVSFKGFLLYIGNIIFVLILIPASRFVVKNSRVPPQMYPRIANRSPLATNPLNYNMPEYRDPQLPPQYQEFNQLPFNPQLIIAQKDLMLATDQST